MSGIIKPVVIALVINKEGKILISKRNDSETPDAHNKWALIGGKVEYGEDPTEALIREVKEETGLILDAKSIKLLPKIFTQLWENRKKEQYQVLLMPYSCSPTGKTEPIQHLDEKISELKYVTAEEAKKHDFLPLDLEIIDCLIHKP